LNRQKNMDIGRKNAKVFWVVFLLVFVVGGFFLYKNLYPNTAKKNVPPIAGFQNFILVGWDGAQREHVLKLLSEGKLPNLKKLVAEGGIVNTAVTTATTETKAGWAEILTGYNAETLGIYDNLSYKPIPEGYTIFERLENYFGKDNIATLFVGGKIDNIGARGAHKICVNCITRYPDTREKTFYKDEGTLAPTYIPGEERILEDREGDPYYYTKDALDVFEVGLGSAANVGPKVIDYLEQYKDRRFFAFLHFEEPDELGHKYGGGSKEYLDSIIANDHWLGQIVAKLKQLGLYEKTLVYVTSDHGFAEGQLHHKNEPDTFLAANDSRLKKDGDRKDVTPTILHRYGVDIASLTPLLDGVSLADDAQPVRIGYFHGGRVNMIYRTFLYNYFDQEGVAVELYTKYLYGDEIVKVPKTNEATLALLLARERQDSQRNVFGKMSGTEIVEKIMAGEFDGGTIGESSFLASIQKGLPIVAVAMLGYDAVPGKGIIMRSDVKINSPSDFKGKTLISRRAGPGDAIFLREFLGDIGLVPGKDLTMIDQVGELDAETWLEEKKIDGGLYHLVAVKRLVDSGLAYVYRPMDWMDSAISHALLVFHKDYVANHREEVQRVVQAYVKRVAYEKSIPDEQRDRSWDKGLMMEGEFEGMEIPTYDLPPKIRTDLLEAMQGLLLKYGEIDQAVDITNFVDTSFVDNAFGA